MFQKIFQISLISFLLMGSNALAAHKTIHEAAKAGDAKAIGQFIEKGDSINLKNSSGMTPLLVALQNQQEKTAAWLIEKGADVTLADYSNRTSLYWAIRGKATPIAVMLLEKGADPKVKALGNETILSVAAVAGDITVVNLLLEKGIVPESGQKIARSPIYRAVQQGHLDVVKRLLEYYPDKAHILAYYAKPKEVEAALKASNQTLHSKLKETKETLLHCAAHGKNRKLVAYLLKKGAEPNKKDHYDQTPLHVAAIKNDAKIASMLLKGGALIHLRSNTKQTPLEMAIDSKSKKTIKLLTKQNKKLVAWFQAAANGKVKTIQKLSKRPFYLNATDDKGWTALHHAAQNKQKEVIATLASAEMDMDIVNQDGNTAMLMALEANDLELLAFITDQPNVDKNRSNGVGLGPIHIAARDNNKDALDVLLKAGVSINQSDMHGYYPLTYAKRKKHDSMIKYIEAKGGKPGQGLPPLVLALNKPLASKYAFCEKKATHLTKMAHQFTKGKSAYSRNTGRKLSQQAGAYIKIQQKILSVAVYLNRLEKGSPQIPKIHQLGKEMNTMLSGINQTYPNFKRINRGLSKINSKLYTLKTEAEE